VLVVLNHWSYFILLQPPNGSRYPLVGGTRQRRFDGTSFEPRKLPVKRGDWATIAYPGA